MPDVNNRRNPAVDEGYEHRIGARLHDYDYNDSIDKDDLVVNIRECIDSLYTTSLDKQRAACGIKRVGGMMSDFKRDSNANAFYGFSVNTYALKFPLKNVFWFNTLFVNRLNRTSTGYKRKNYVADRHIKTVNTARHRKFFSLSDVYPTPINYAPNQTISTGNISHRLEPKYDTSTGKLVSYYKITEKVNPSDPNADPIVVSKYEFQIMKSDTGETYYQRIQRIPEPPSGTQPVTVYTLDEDDVNPDNFHIMYNTSDTANRPDIFSHQLLFFIDGKLYTDLQMYIVPNYVIMVIDPDRLGLSVSQVIKFTNPLYDYRWTIIGLPFSNNHSTVDGGYKLIPDAYNELEIGHYSKHVTEYSDHNKISYSDLAFSEGLIQKTQYNIPDESTGNVYLTGYASNAESIRIDGRTYRQKTAYFDLALNTANLYSTGSVTTSIATNVSNIDSNMKWTLSFLGNSSKAYESIGTKAIAKFNESLKHDMRFVELKNVAAIIPLGVNRIFQVGCSENIPGPIPPENILIFKHDAEDGLSLVHMITSNYKENTLEDSVYGKETKIADKPAEKSLAFKAVETDSLYDYPKFIPTKDVYDVGEDVHGTYTVEEYTDKVLPSGYVEVQSETVTKQIDTVRETQKWIELYFPNVFKLVGFNNDDNLIAVVFYNKSCKNTFDNPLAEYMNYDQYYANNVVSGNIPEVIKEYIPIVNRYTEDVYLDTYHTQATRAIEPQFKLEALREFINDDYRRIVNIYDRHYAKKNNKMHANVKYVIDLTKTRDEATESDKFNVKHFYKDQFELKDKVTYIPYVDKLYDSTTGNVYKINHGVELFTHNRDGSYLCNISTLGMVDVPPEMLFQRVTLTGVSLYMSEMVEGLSAHILQTYRFVISHKEKMKFPATVWVDGIRIANTLYNISSSVFETYIDISMSAIYEDTKYVEIEIYKMKDINAKETIITLPKIHNSIELNAGPDVGGWDEISPQHMMVAIQKETIGQNGETRIRYMVPSSYEMSWLLFGNYNYIEGYPTNADDEYRHHVSVNTFNVIKSMQGSYIDGSGQTVERNDVALLADENVALIGETAQTFNGNVDLLKTFGYDQYFKALTDDATRNEYVLMLREGFYSRDRRRFYDYLPMGKNDRKVYITPITEFFENQTVKLKNTDVYFNKVYSMTVHAAQDSSRQLVIPNFQFDPSPFKFRLFLDGKLLDYDFDYTSNVHLDDENFFMDSDMTLYLRKQFDYDAVHDIVFEYLPYKYRLIYRSNEFDAIITLTDEHIRPFDFRHFDVYLDGLLLTEDDIQVVTERRIVIKPIADRINTGDTNYHPIVSVYERMHDEDVFDYVWRNHKLAFDYIDHRDPTRYSTYVDPITGETIIRTQIDPVTGEEVPVMEDNVKRHPSDPEQYLDIKLAQRIKFSLDEQLLRALPEYKSFRIPSYSYYRSSREGPRGFGG